jgi:hypothetical protein
MVWRRELVAPPIKFFLFCCWVMSLQENDDLLAAKSPQKVAKTANK